MSSFKFAHEVLLKYFWLYFISTKLAFSAQYLGPEYNGEDNGDLTIMPVFVIPYLFFLVWIYSRQGIISNFIAKHPFIGNLFFLFVFPTILIFMIVFVFAHKL